MCAGHVKTTRKFQLTRSRGARRNSHTRGGALRYFNSRAHVERDSLSNISSQRHSYFNSRAHVERDTTGKDINFMIIQISTHALTWSATM